MYRVSDTHTGGGGRGEEGREGVRRGLRGERERRRGVSVSSLPKLHLVQLPPQLNGPLQTERERERERERECEREGGRERERDERERSDFHCYISPHLLPTCSER